MDLLVNYIFMKYSFLKGLSKALTAFLIFGIPVILEVLPSETLNITLGSALVMLLNYLKVAKGVKLP